MPENERGDDQNGKKSHENNSFQATTEVSANGVKIQDNRDVKIEMSDAKGEASEDTSEEKSFMSFIATRFNRSS